MESGSTARLLGALLIAGLGCGAAGAQDAPAPAPAAVVAPVPALTPEQAAFRDALLAETAGFDAAERTAIEGFYAERAYAPFWAETANLDGLLAALETAEGQALPYQRYEATGVRALFQPGATAAPAARELAATRAYLRYAGDVNSGALRPSRIDPEIAIAPTRLAPALLLGKLDGASVAEVLAGLAPRAPDYAALIAEKARLEAASAAGTWGPTVPTGPTLHEGETGPRIAELRARLARMGYETAMTETPGDFFDAGLVEEVKAFQRDHGLNADGAVGQHTLAEINASPRDRLEQVVVNLERARWLNRDFGPRYILVNIPDYRATVYQGGGPVWTSKVVVGEAKKTRTTEFSEVMSYIVVNPSWNVPSSIAKRDYLPKLRHNPSALSHTNMQLLTPAGTVIDPRLVDWNALGDSFPFRIRQSPSDGNALGKVKFMFPNDHAIYLHDTPHRELFARDARAFSNGCIRVQDPDGLARLLLAGQVDDPAAAFDGWVAAKAEKTVTLRNPIPVNIVYRTVFLDDAGVIRYRDDVYGRDAEVFSALEAAGVSLPLAEG
ncbi:MAG: murein L,D-transpeptidase [Rhodovulum sulfidophilum]|uniref:Murein L,D-transpeptidase n=1 Tax=Rhodovulum sulfidophilum TaxID=35806 RepID=A0A2W5NB25_RHOSU|nr:MAG: murein L,D-transpeptidase [Rhodovulum sulfidophilum]